MRYQDVAASATNIVTGDGSVLDTILRTGVEHVPVLGAALQITHEVGSLAHADMAMKNSVASLTLATSGGLMSLHEAALTYDLEASSE